jgi:hypothetical protein
MAYQQALAARRPKKQMAAQPVELWWKNIAGFNKLVLPDA